MCVVKKGREGGYEWVVCISDRCIILSLIIYLSLGNEEDDLWMQSDHSVVGLIEYGGPTHSGRLKVFVTRKFLLV